MAKVSLRIYNREIEGLIDHGQIEEAIAHCRHILKTFPKHLETYRLLGKAYLEQKQYGEAVDIFSRVLMSVPDDFVSHVAMSIVNDEQNKLDNAIWHMERAFEAQPSNPAINGELQRLYGRRDGMEPPKIRMTRGALAHMYVQGELYPQAVAEIRAVLAQDDKRADMQVLLARAFFKSGQKADASDMCMQLLKRYPYSLDANRILVELLPATAGAAESTQVYRMRVGELDPYATFAKGSVFQSGEVADAAINLERLEYKGEDVPLGQEWSSSLGIKLGDSSVSSSQSDWLSSTPASQLEPTADTGAQASEEIPDFLRAAGWGSSTGPEQPTSFFDETDAGGDLAAADIPDWLKQQMPSGTTGAEIAPPPEAQSMMDTPDWLSGLGAAAATGSSFETEKSQPAPAEKNDVPDWLGGLGNAPAAEIPSPSSVPDWLSGGEDKKATSTEATLPPAGEAPDWLRGLEDKAEPAPAETKAQPGNVPDWLRGLEDVPPAAPQDQQPASVESLGASAQEQDDAVAWLESLAAKHGAKPEELVTDPSKRSETPPEWVDQARNASQPQSQPASVESLGASAQEQDDAVAWLESLAAKHGAKPEELVTDPSKRSETPPEWVDQARNAAQSQPASVENLGASTQEQDDAVAWLESLAAKHGAKPEELVTDPNKRSETPPEWVDQARAAAEAQAVPVKQEWSENAQNIGEQFFAEFADTSEGEDKSIAEKQEWSENAQNIGEQFFAEFEDAVTREDASIGHGDIPDWLKDDAPSSVDESQETLKKEDLPEWLDETESGGSAVLGNESFAQDDLANWLSGLDEAEKSEPKAVSVPEWREEPAQPEVPAAKADLPDWMSGLDNQSDEADDEWKKSVDLPPAKPVEMRVEEPVPASSTPEPASVQLSEDLPDWLSAEEEPVKELAESDDDEVPEWLSQPEPDQKAAPKPTAPTDWHPVEKKPTPQKEKAAAQPKSAQSRSQSAEAKPKAQKQSAAETKSKVEPVGHAAAVDQAKVELDRGDIPTALGHYKKLIKKGKHLEEIIHDLTEALYRYPVEIGIWQALGDAYMRANRLKEALEAYSKAEELIR